MRLNASPIYVLALSLLSVACSRGNTPADELNQGTPVGANETDDSREPRGAEERTTSTSAPAGDGDENAEPAESEPPQVFEPVPFDGPPERALRPDDGDAFVHLFEWRWLDIAHECETFLGPNGFTAVQVSPASEHLVLPNHPWWQRYQVVSYDLDNSRSGTRAEFVNMVERCAVAGVGIYVDAVINHMTGMAPGMGSNGTSFSSKYSYPGLYGPDDFHSPACTISGSDYANNAENVQSCELLGLADLNTSNPEVQTTIAGYLTELVEIGVAGFRIDAAKHMAPEDISSILGLVSEAVGAERSPFVFLEVIDYGGEAVSAADYLPLEVASNNAVRITEFRYTGVGDVFFGTGGQSLASLSSFGEPGWGLMASGRAVVFTNNHDTQRAHGIFYQAGARNDLANVFSLTQPYGYPKVMSSFAFDRDTDAGKALGPPSEGNGVTRSVFDADGMPQCGDASPETTDSWICEHRRAGIAKLLSFRRAAAGVPVSDFWDNGANQIAFGRGEHGFVVINAEGAPLEQTFETGLPEGRYCELLSGGSGDGECQGLTVDVDEEGRWFAEVPPDSALVLSQDDAL